MVAAAEVRAKLTLDRVLIVVAGDPWQKRGDVVATARDRLAMVEAAVDGIEGLEASGLETDRVGPTYTVDTLEQLAVLGRALFLVMGADVARGLDTWHDVARVRELATLVVVEREGETGVAPPHGDWRIERVAVPRLDISSTDLRARLREGRPVDGLIPPAAIRVIRERGLYTPHR